MTVCTNSNERQLIVYGCQTVIPKHQLEEMSKLLGSGGIDWKFVLNVAQRNAVLPLLSWNLQNHHFAQLLPDKI